MPILSKTPVDTASELSRSCFDSAANFTRGANLVANPHLKDIFHNHASERSFFAGKLGLLVADSGQSAPQEGHWSEALHRLWMDVRQLAASDHDLAVLSELERSEDRVKRAYEDALTDDLPDAFRTLMATQLTSIRKTHDRVRDLRDAMRLQNQTKKTQ